MKQKNVEYRIEVKGVSTDLDKLKELEKVLKVLQDNPGLISNSNDREEVIQGINFLSKELELLNKEIYKVANTSTHAGEELQAVVTESESNIKNLKDGAYDVSNLLPLKLGNFWTAAKKMIFAGLDELSSYTTEGLINKRQNLIELYGSFEKEISDEILKVSEKIDLQQKQQNAGRVKIEKKQEDERRKESQKSDLFDINDSIKQHEAELGEIWKFTEEGQEIYKAYFDAKRNLYQSEGKDLLEVQREQNDYENEITKFYQERDRAAIEEKYKEDKVALKNQLAERQITKEEYAQKEEDLTIAYLENEITLRNSYGKDTIDLEEQLVDTRLAIRVREEALALQNATLTQTIADTEGKSLKTRIQQWKEYAQKVSAISQKVSEATGLATKSLSSMFSQLSASYTQELESINGKITALDEEKEAALERATLTQDERRAREEELEQQTMNSMYAITHEQKNKADERIAILQGELNAEDTVSREFESKKADLEKEKEKKEKAQKKAEKQKKRLDMGQAIVEATGNIAQGVAKALSHGPILGPILAAIVAGAGAVQVGIMTKQLSKMEDGGLLHGKRHSQGGMPILGSNIEVEGGEYVVNRQSTAKNLGLLSYINEQRRQLNSNDMHSFFSSPQPRIQAPQYAHLLEKGGQVPMLPVQVDISNSELLAGIQNIKIEPRVAVTDIMHVHDQMVRVDEWVGMR